MEEARPESYRRSRFAGRLLGLLLALLIVATITAQTARWSWSGEITASLRWHLGWFALVCGALALTCGRRRAAALSLALCLWHVVPEARLYWPLAARDSGGESWTLVTGNLRWRNDDAVGVRRWLASVDPDLVFAQEVSPRWRAVLTGLTERFPHQLYSPPEPWGTDEWGTAVLSRIPFERTRMIEPGVDRFRPLIEVGLILDGEELTVRSAHPVRPAEPDAWRRRNVILGTLCDEPWDERSLLVGDLNTTSTSPIFQDLLANGLSDSRRGFGRQPTFVPPPKLPFVRVAIDHVLVGERIEVLERRTEEIPGSDHRGVVVRFALTREREVPPAGL